MRYSKTKREKVGPCNLCREERALSWDHVPPKGGVEISRMEMASLLDLLGGVEKPPVEESQNGVKYRTICKECNELLGVEYDPHLNGLAREVGACLLSPIELPKHMDFEICPQRLMKALLGHMVAAKVAIENTKFDRSARAFVLDPHATLPEDIHIHYWSFPYDMSATLRDSAIVVPMNSGGVDINFVQIMKYFPVAYLASDKARYRNLSSLSMHRKCGLNDVKKLRMDFDRIEKPFWPEEPSDAENSSLFVGQSGGNAVYAKRRIAHQK